MIDSISNMISRAAENITMRLLSSVLSSVLVLYSNMTLDDFRCCCQ